MVVMTMELKKVAVALATGTLGVIREPEVLLDGAVSAADGDTPTEA
jgi:hypothetical protein